MPLIHPTDRQLAALIDGQVPPVDGRRVAEHVSGCARCQQRVGQAVADPADLPGLDPAPAASAVVPAGGAFEDRGQDPAAGDVWRVAWEGTTGLALVRHADPQNLRVTALPIMEVSDADEWSLLTSFTMGDVEVPVAASVALEVTLPWCVLDARMGALSSEAMRAVDRIVRAFRARVDPPDDVELGDPLWSRLDERADALDDLAEQFHELANVDWVPADQPVQEATSEVPDFATLRHAGLPTDRALDLSRGDRPTPDEAAAIEQAIGHPVAAAGAVVPLDLRRRFDRPRWRPAVRGRAAATRRSESDERLAVVAEVTQPMAARGARGESIDWDFLLQRVLG